MRERNLRQRVEPGRHGFILSRGASRASPRAERGAETARSSCRGRARRGATRRASRAGPPSTSRRRCSSRSLPPGNGRQIWPPWKWPARTRWKSPGWSRGRTSGKWHRRIRRSAPGSASRPGSRRAWKDSRRDPGDLDARAADVDGPRRVREELRAGFGHRRRVARPHRTGRASRRCRGSRARVNVPCRGRSAASVSRSAPAPRRRLSRSPVTHARS